MSKRPTVLVMLAALSGCATVPLLEGRIAGLRDVVEGGKRLGPCAVAEIAAQTRDPQIGNAAVQTRQGWFISTWGLRRVVCIGPLHHIIGQGQIGDRPRKGPQMIKACHKGKGAVPRQPPIGGL